MTAYRWLFILLIFQIIDVITTYYLVNLGADEYNVIILYLMKHFGDIAGLIVLKIFGMMLLFIFVPFEWDRLWVRLSIYTVNVCYFIVCVINIYFLIM